MIRALLLLLAIVSLATSSNAYGQEAQAPIYKDGDCWLFRSENKNYVSSVSGDSALPKNGDHNICFAQGKFFALDGAARSTLSDASLWNALLYMKDNRQLRFPLIVGQKWGDQFQTRLRGTNRLEWRNSETRVLDFDHITTPDGPHSAFKIQRDNWCRHPSARFAQLPEIESDVWHGIESRPMAMARIFWGVGTLMYLPASIPERLAEILRQAFRVTFNDRGFDEQYRNVIRLNPTALMPKEQQKLIATLPRNNEVIKLCKSIAGLDPLLPRR